MDCITSPASSCLLPPLLPPLPAHPPLLSVMDTAKRTAGHTAGYVPEKKVSLGREQRSCGWRKVFFVFFFFFFFFFGPVATRPT